MGVLRSQVISQCDLMSPFLLESCRTPSSMSHLHSVKLSFVPQRWKLGVPSQGLSPVQHHSPFLWQKCQFSYGCPLSLKLLSSHSSRASEGGLRLQLHWEELEELGQKGHMTPLEPSAVRSGFCWLDFNCSHLAITRLGPEVDCTPVGTELGDGEPSSDSQCLSLSPVVPDVLPLAF